LIAIADGEGELRHELWPDALRALLLACIRGRSWSRLGSVSSAAEAG
jgi:hypothetical protein